MTDEEKIKKARGIICHNCRWNECDNDSCPTLRDTVKAIELGLAEGRKVTEAHLLDNWCKNEEGYCPHLNRLEKENAELKAEKQQIQEQVKQILLDDNAEIGQLREVVGLDWCDKDYVEKLEKELAELKAQIESYRNAVEKCRHIPYIGVGDEVCHTVVEYAQKVDGILFSVEGVDYWFKRLGK